MGDCPDYLFLQAMGVELSENEKYFVGHSSGIRIVSEPRTAFFPRRNTFAALIDGSDHRLKLDGEWSLHFSLGGFIYRDTGLAKLLQAVVGYKKVFVGAYGLVEPGGTAADKFHAAVAKSRLCIESRDFQYAGKSCLAYAAGVEFPC